MRERKPPSTAKQAREPHLMDMPNGAEVYTKDSTRLKGYVINHAPGKGLCEAFDAKKQSLGTGTQAQCFAMLDTSKAVRVASEVFIEGKETRKRK